MLDEGSWWRWTPLAILLRTQILGGDASQSVFVYIGTLFVDVNKYNICIHIHISIIYTYICFCLKIAYGNSRLLRSASTTMLEYVDSFLFLGILQHHIELFFGTYQIQQQGYIVWVEAIFEDSQTNSLRKGHWFTDSYFLQALNDFLGMISFRQLLYYWEYLTIYVLYILCIAYVYLMYVFCMYHVYLVYMPCIFKYIFRIYSVQT